MAAFEYLPAWSFYLLTGCGFCLFWWRLTRDLTNITVRELLRGLILVLIFTPWFAGDYQEHFAPALLVLMFELLFVETKHGQGSGLALLAALSLMVVVLAVRQWWGRKGNRAAAREGR